MDGSKIDGKGQDVVVSRTNTRVVSVRRRCEILLSLRRNRTEVVRLCVLKLTALYELVTGRNIPIYLPRHLRILSQPCQLRISLAAKLPLTIGIA